MSKDHNIIDKIVHGYGHLEGPILAGIALGKNLMVCGPHGVGKSTAFEVLGRALDETGNGFAFFASDKADLVILGGFPDVEAAKHSKFAFVPTPISIWGKKILMADELPRADSTKQNYWMEIMEHGTFQGLPHEAEMVVATGNDVTYQSNYVDPALRSRFLFWLPTPKFDRVESQDVIKMIKMNLDRMNNNNWHVEFARDLHTRIVNIKRKLNDILSNVALMDQIAHFIGLYIQVMKDQIANNATLSNDMEAFVSPREFASQLPLAIAALYAYYDEIGASNALVKAGRDAVKYNIETRHAAAGEEFTMIAALTWRQVYRCLEADASTEGGMLQMKFAGALYAPQKIDFWRNFGSEVTKHLDNSEIHSMAGDTLKQVQNECPELTGALWYEMDRNNTTKFIANQVRGFMVTEIARRMIISKSTGGDRVLWDKYSMNTKLTPEMVADILSHHSEANAA